MDVDDQDIEDLANPDFNIEDDSVIGRIRARGRARRLEMMNGFEGALRAAAEENSESDRERRDARGDRVPFTDIARRAPSEEMKESERRN